MNENIIGREQELNILDRILSSNESEFVAIYGRRRVGKTFLIREYFEEQMVFYHTGIANVSQREELKAFAHALTRYGGNTTDTIEDWIDAFEQLALYIDSLPNGRKVIFLDELPWMDEKGQGVIPALEHFWNSYASLRKDIILVVCGSATSWMLDKVIGDHGGLYGRLTHRIKLGTFSLKETEEYLNTRGIMWSRYEIAECYMIFGGIPYYLKMLDSKLSLAQNIDRLLFNPNGELYDEFNMLYRSLFSSSESYIDVINTLNNKSIGLTRQEILDNNKKISGKKLSQILKDLDACGFIRKYTNYRTNKANAIYQLVDFFSLFYLRFVKNTTLKNPVYWSSLQGTSKFYSWAGLSFEMLALSHEEAIKNRLGISGVATSSFGWKSKSTDNNGYQIDLLIDRGDNTINVCEVKFSEKQYEIDKSYAEKIRKREQLFREDTDTRKSLQTTFITTYGVKKNNYYSVVTNEIVLDDLFY